MAGPSRSAACTFCKKRKRKCDGEQPCSICKKYNRNGACEYLADQDKRKFKYDSTYIDYLELKTDILQQLADDLIRSNPAKARSIDAALVDRRPKATQEPQAVSQKSKTQDNILQTIANQEAIDELISTKWRVRQDYGGNTEFYGPISGRQHVLENIEEEEVPQLHNYQMEQIISSEDIRNGLIDAFLKHFGNYFYIAKLTIDEIKNWDLQSQNLSQQFLLYSIFTFGSVFNDDTRPLASLFLQKAESLALRSCKKIDENVVQALLVLSCFELGMGLDTNSWIFDAMTSATTQFLRLDRLNDQSELKNNSNFLFWSVIMQDRIITSVLGRGCRLQYFRITTPFLTDELCLIADTDLSGLAFAYHSKLWYIHDKFLSQIYSFKADYLHNSHRLALMKQGIETLQEFYDTLPENLKYTEELEDPKLLILHLSYTVAFLLLHRTYLKQIPFKVIQVTISQCEKAAILVKKLYNNKSYDAPHFISYLILTVATFDLFLMANKDKSFRENSLMRMQIYIDGLKKFGKYWKRCLKDIKVLSELARKWNLEIATLQQCIDENSYDSDFDSNLGVALDVDEFFHHFNPSPTG